jgi:hypothetical protein
MELEKDRHLTMRTQAVQDIQCEEMSSIRLTAGYDRYQLRQSLGMLWIAKL